MVLPLVGVAAGWALKKAVTAAAVFAAKKTIGAGLDAYKEFKKTAEEKAADRIDSRQPCTQTKEERVRARQQAIKAADEKLQDPRISEEDKKALQAARDRFARNNTAVEHAKLSEHSYDQFDPTLRGAAPKGPPVGWEVAKPEDLGLDPAMLEPPPPSTFRAVVYKNSFGLKPAYTVAFRGTEPRAGHNDIAADIANAAGQETDSYAKAKDLADALQDNPQLAGNFAVTGHSLGGGLAQTAAMQIKPPPKAFMFNSAGPHPDVVGLTPSAMAKRAAGFQQFRSPCDPLTAASGMHRDQGAVTKAMQATARGLQWAASKVLDSEQVSDQPVEGDFKVMRAVRQVTGVEEQVANNRVYGWHIPPNHGAMTQVSSKDDSGKDVPCLDPGPQHSITNLVNGMEHEKTVDLLTLQKHGVTTVRAMDRKP
jgi:hypothetical protein